MSANLDARPAAGDALRARIGPGLVVCLGLSQLLAWGTMHYLTALFASPMAADLGWSTTFVQGGFSLGLLVMGAASFRVGAWIDRHGGRAAMMAGCWLGAAGCALLALTRHELTFLAAWVLLGLGMRLALYDAAFASLAHVAGAAAKRPIALITLFGGLASTVFWPLGHALARAHGWRGALAAYAVLLVLGSLLHLALPRSAVTGGGAATKRHAAPPPAPPAVPGALPLYAVIAICVLFLQTGMASQFVELLRGLGWDAGMAVALSTLFGMGQVTGRSCVVLWATGVHAVRLNLLPSALQCLCFVLYLAGGRAPWVAAAFAFLYGAGNGIATITRGTMPLALFDPATYGRVAGQVLRPAFALAAAAPMVLAFVVERAGHRSAAALALGIAATALAAAVVLNHRVMHTRSRP